MWIIKNSDGVPVRIVTDEADALEAGQTRAEATDVEVAAAQGTIETAARLAARDEARRTRYVRETDPLYFKAQRGEATLQQWIDKVAEIKADLP